MHSRRPTSTRRAALAARAFPLGALAVACHSVTARPDDVVARATATLTTAAGAPAGTVALAALRSGEVTLAATLRGLTPGAHGMHLHAVGTCDAAGAFASAGGHHNPLARRHGLESADGPHAGDLPNVTADAAGVVHVTLTTTHASLGEGAASLLDADGSAVAVHAGHDDQRSDPAGNSGARVACGVVRRVP